MLRDACNNHPQADRLGWSSQQRRRTLNRLQTTLLEATQIVLIGAAIDAASLERPWTDGTVFVAADGAVGACFGRVEVACVVSDLDGEPYLSQAVEKAYPWWYTPMAIILRHGRSALKSGASWKPHQLC